MAAFRLTTPMRAADLKGDISQVRFPIYASAKHDGYRATVQRMAGGIVLLSKNNKPIPNDYCQDRLARPEFEGLDGELIVGRPTDPGCLQATSSGVTKRAGAPDVTFWCFDALDLQQVFRIRLQHVLGRLAHGGYARAVGHVLLRDAEELAAFEAKCLGLGYEGVMLRGPDGIYKQQGTEPRSTVTEQYVMKLKRVEHHEARVLEVYEEMENANEATRDEIGRTKRSTAAAGKRGKGVLGGCRVQGISGRWEGVVYDVGTGFTAAQREGLWSIHKGANGTPLIDRIMKVTTGVTPATFKKPQFPRFADWKWEGDL